LIRRIARSLDSADLPAPEREAHWIVECALATAGSSVGSTNDLDEEIARVAQELLQRRLSGEPLQYVTGVAGFRHLELSVGPGVMVPRPETEVVAEKAMEVLPPGGLVVDVGTGSGAIALGIAQERPDATVIATELSLEAARWARRNRDAHALPVHLIVCDLLSALSGDLRERVQLVVANLPYVSTRESASLPPEVVDHEPHGSLFAGADGTEVLRRLIDEGPRWLAPGGWIVLEIGMTQGGVMSSLLVERGFDEVSTERDLTGRERIARARWPQG
jgi:release factor glutamine methyltransferase